MTESSQTVPMLIPQDLYQFRCLQPGPLQVRARVEIGLGFCIAHKFMWSRVRVSYLSVKPGTLERLASSEGNRLRCAR